MDRLTGQADECRVRALICARAGRREEAKRWIMLARKFELAESVSAFIEWTSQRIEPPEAFRR